MHEDDDLETLPEGTKEYIFPWAIISIIIFIVMDMSGYDWYSMGAIGFFTVISLILLCLKVSYIYRIPVSEQDTEREKKDDNQV